MDLGFIVANPKLPFYFEGKIRTLSETRTMGFIGAGIDGKDHSLSGAISFCFVRREPDESGNRDDNVVISK